MRLAAEPGRRYQIGPLVRVEDDRDRVRAKRRAQRLAESLFSALREWLASSCKAEQIMKAEELAASQPDGWRKILVSYRQVPRR
jgi:hypothetical protein